MKRSATVLRAAESVAALAERRRLGNSLDALGQGELLRLGCATAAPGRLGRFAERGSVSRSEMSRSNVTFPRSQAFPLPSAEVTLLRLGCATAAVLGRLGFFRSAASVSRPRDEPRQRDLSEGSGDAVAEGFGQVAAADSASRNTSALRRASPRRRPDLKDALFFVAARDRISLNLIPC